MPAGSRSTRLTLQTRKDQIIQILEESKEQGALIGSPNQVEAVMANLQKRAPQFAD